MAYKVTVMLPLHDNEGNTFDDDLINKYVEKLSCNGATTTRCKGYYRSDVTNSMMIDINLKVEIILYSLTLVDLLKMYCKEAKEELQQECIYFEIQQTDVAFIK